MSGKYNRTKKHRTHGRYRERLEARGLHRPPTMPDYGLRIDKKGRGR